MEHDAAQNPAYLHLHCVRFPDAPAETWEAAMTLLAQAVTLAGVRLPASDGRLERQDAIKLMAALADLRGQVPRASKSELDGTGPIDVDATLGSR